MPTIEISILVVSYLMGSISSAIIISKLLGLGDPRDSGSHNPGATNMVRLAGKKVGALTFLGDILKGVIPVLIAQYFELSMLWTSGVVVAAFLGHCLPIFFSFKGGKGVATIFGAISTMNWQIGLILFIVWMIFFILFRISSLSAISAAISLPFATHYLAPESFLPMSILALLMIWRHQENIKGLLSGNENRII